MSVSDFTFKVEKLSESGDVLDEVLLEVVGPTGCFDSISIDKQKEYYLGIFYKILGEYPEYLERFPIGVKVRMILLDENPRVVQ